MKKFPAKIAVAAAAFLALSACAGGGAARSNAAASLNAFNDAFNARAAAHDEAAFLRLYDAETLWIAAPKPPAAGHGEPRKAFRFLKDNDGMLAHDIDHLFISDDGTLAVMIGTADFAVETLGMKGDGTYLFVLRRRGGGWTIAADMFHQHDQAGQ